MWGIGVKVLIAFIPNFICISHIYSSLYCLFSIAVSARFIQPSNLKQVGPILLQYIEHQQPYQRLSF